MIFSLLKSAFARLGYTLEKDARSGYFSEMADLYAFCSPYTMTSHERMFALYKSVEYIVQHNIPGDFVECGVWKGGSSMLMAKTLLHFGIKDRVLWLYDTFEGMSEPTEQDKDLTGKSADDLLKSASKADARSVWCYSTLDEVKANLISTGYPAENIRFIQGKVEDSIPANMPQGDIALLRLDTDWYESTKHELIHLYPHLVQQGVLIIDDYGHWVGAKKAVDEYLQENHIPLLLNMIDYSGRIAVKP